MNRETSGSGVEESFKSYIPGRVPLLITPSNVLRISFCRPSRAQCLLIWLTREVDTEQQSKVFISRPFDLD